MTQIEQKLVRAAVVACLATMIVSRLSATEYYVDSENGSDHAAGTSPEAAWRTLAPVNDAVLRPGDKLLFKAGSSFAGQLKPVGRGTKEAPILIGMYGKGAKPRIDGEGAFEAAVYIYNTEYVTVENLEVTNTGKTAKPRRRGVKVHIKDFGTAHGITLRNLYIHDVNGSIFKKQGGGGAVFWHNEGTKTKSRFDGLLIEDCHFKRCVRNGVNARGYGNRSVWYPSLNVVVRRCLLEEIPGDGIVPIACDGALIEHNVMRDCTRLLEPGDAAAGIWPFSCDNTVIQFNEVSDHKAPWDAQGFDSDWNCRNTLIQYNYSHDNEGGFLLVCNNGKYKSPGNAGNIGTVVRYNISVNDGLRPEPTRAKGMFSPTFHISGPCRDTQIYNNLIYITKKPNPSIDRTLLQMDNWGGPWPEDTKFWNNIFVTEDRTTYDNGKATGTEFKNNLYFGRHENRPADPMAIVADPRFVGAEKMATGRETLSRFGLASDSPCIGKGIVVPDFGGRDFFGRAVPDDRPPSLGPIEYIALPDKVDN